MYFKSTVTNADKINANPVTICCEKKECLSVAVWIAPANDGPNLAAVIKNK